MSHSLSVCSRSRQHKTHPKHCRPARAELKRLLNEDWEYTLRTQPEFATYIGDDRYNDRLSDSSLKAINEDLEHKREALRRFEALDETEVDRYIAWPAQALSYKMGQ